jgi:hypothetical protein
MEKKNDEELNWPTAFLLAVVIIVGAAFAAGPEFWLMVFD